MAKIKIYALNDGYNSISFFKKAFEEGADAVQCDIRRTLDGQFIAFRDRTLSRLCGRDWVVQGTSWSHIKNLPVRNGEKIPHLDEILKFMVLRPFARFFLRAMLNTPRDISDLARQVSKAGIQNRVFITLPSSHASFSYAAKRTVNGICTAIFSSWPIGIAEKAIKNGIDEICLLPGGFPGSGTFMRFFSATESIAKQSDAASAAGIGFSIGTVNGPNTLRRALSVDPAAIWTYDVPLAARLLK